MTDAARTITEAGERFIARLVEDLSQILGAGILIEELELAPDEAGPSRIRVLILFDGGAETLEAEGATSLEAYNRLVVAAAELRLVLAWRRLLAPI